MQSLYRGEAGKMLLSGVMFAVVFAVVRPINAALVVIGFLAMQVLYLGMAASCLGGKKDER